MSDAGFWIGALWCAATGASLASFGRLAAHRLARGASLCWPPSHCDACGARIRARHLVPVLGWCLARGRCPDCAARIPRAHPCVEAACGAGWAALWIGAGGAWMAVPSCLIAQAAVFLADLAWQLARTD